MPIDAVMKKNEDSNPKVKERQMWSEQVNTQHDAIQKGIKWFD